MIAPSRPRPRRPDEDFVLTEPVVRHGKGWSGGKQFVPRRSCEVCGVPFYAPPVLMRRGGGRFCSKKCRGIQDSIRRARTRPMKPCLSCGTPIAALACKPRKKFCSKACVSAFKAKQREIVACVKCAKPIVKSPSSKREACSNKCRRRPERKPLPICICETCGKPFGKLAGNRGRFCNMRCFAIAQGKANATRKPYSTCRGGKRSDLEDRYFRSSWEANWARYLNWLKSVGEIEAWEYEPDTFEFTAIKRGARFYTPDFKVTNRGGSIEYHEIKGWMDQRSATKLARMAKYYPDVKIVVIEQRLYAEVRRKVSGLLPQWEHGTERPANGQAAEWAQKILEAR